MDFDKAFDILLDNYRKISDSLPHVSAIESLFHVHPHVQLLLAHVYKDILTFHERAVAFFKRRGAYTCVVVFRVQKCSLTNIL